MTRRVELTGHQARHQAAVGGEHLVRIDHREAVAKGQHDARPDAGQFRRQFDVLRHLGHPAPRGVIEPMHPEQIQGMWAIGTHVLEFLPNRHGDRRRVSELPDRW